MSDRKGSTPNKLPPLPDRALSRETMAFCLEKLVDVVESAIRDGDWKVDGACDPDMALTFAKRALGLSPEHRSAEAISQSQSLPEPSDDDLPVPIAYGMRRKGEISVIGVVPNKVHVKPATSETYLREFEEVALFTAEQLHAAREQAFHDGQCQALRHSQSLPAGAVANFRDWFAIAFPVTDLEANDGDVNASSARHVARTAWCAALQADAREKGEAFDGYLVGGVDFYYPDFPQDEIARKRAKGITVREIFYATQPAQASEKDDKPRMLTPDELANLRETVAGWHAEATHPQPVTPAGGEVEPVAEIGRLWSLVYVGSDPLADVVKRHRLAIGTKLYTHPPVADSALVLPDRLSTPLYGDEPMHSIMDYEMGWNACLDKVAALNQRGGG